MGPTGRAVGKSFELRDFSWLRRCTDGGHHAEAPADLHRMTRGYLIDLPKRGFYSPYTLSSSITPATSQVEPRRTAPKAPLNRQTKTSRARNRSCHGRPARLSLRNNTRKPNNRSQ